MKFSIQWGAGFSRQVLSLTLNGSESMKTIRARLVDQIEGADVEEKEQLIAWSVDHTLNWSMHLCVVWVTYIDLVFLADCLADCQSHITTSLGLGFSKWRRTS